MILASLVSVMLAASADAAEPVPKTDPIKTAMEAEWKKIAPKVPGRDGPWFGSERTIFFPASWPDDGKHLTVYFYARIFDPNRHIADGEICGTVWAKALVERSSRRVLTVTRLVDKVEELGIQGIRPIHKEEGAVLTLGDIAAREAPVKTAAEKKKVRDYYCLWRKLDGVIDEKIAPHEKAFYKWLDCASWKSPPQP